MLTSHSDGPAATVGMGYTGAPGESGMVCASCHTGGAISGGFSVDLLGDLFIINEPNTVVFSVLLDDPMYSFQVLLLDNNGNAMPMDYLDLSPGLQATTVGDRTYIEHDGSDYVTDNFSFTFEIDENVLDIAPEALYIYASGIVADGDGTTNGDISLGEGLQAVFPAAFVDVIPVTLTDFTATPFSTSIRLDWGTETEQDNDYFAVEHSVDGNDFTNIKNIIGAGSTDERHTYTYTHTNPIEGNNYYRLRQVDFDGKETLSEIVTAKFSSKFEETTVFPQPASTEATIYLTSSTNESGTMEVYDINGRLIHSNDIQLIEGGNYLNLNCANWVAGHYVIYIQGEQIGKETIHFLKN